MLSSGDGGGADFVSVVRMGFPVVSVMVVGELRVASGMLGDDEVQVLEARSVALASFDGVSSADLVMARCILIILVYVMILVY
jgi:hypothetical protein